MLSEVKDLQNQAVNSLCRVLLSEKKEIVFKAPTGSGKTYMMASLIDKLLADPQGLISQSKNQYDGVIFLVSSLSKGDLAKQNYEKFLEYSSSKMFSHLNPYLINSETADEERLYIPTDYNVYFLPRDLYKERGKLKQGPMDAFLQELSKSKLFGGKNNLLVLIKDECHIKTKNLDELNEYFFKIINFSATPKLSRRQVPDVEMSVDDAVKVKLIKHIDWQDDKETVEDALCEFEKVKKEYNEKLSMNPCLIIQISNRDLAEEEMKGIKAALGNHAALKWMYIVDKDKECDTNDKLKGKIPVSKWKDYAKENTATIDVIIFKMVITEGWDIPRACMLYQVRDTQSKQLDEQVLGRVRRNPRLLDFEKLSSEAQELALSAKVWGVKEQGNNNIYEVELHNPKENFQNEIKIKTTSFKPLISKKDFQIEDFVDKNCLTSEIYHSSIFELGAKIRDVSNEIRNIIENYSTDYQKWWKISELIDPLTKEYNQYNCDYDESLIVTTDEKGVEKEVSLPSCSQYIDKGNYVSIGNNLWKKRDNNDDQFSFDSDAERRWAEILKESASEGCVAKQMDLFDDNLVYLWGKNYIPNSEVRFEYFTDSIHFSYPDFIMKDVKNRIHIFEVKSLNQSKFFNFDCDEYQEKVLALKKAYQYASKLTKQIFYLPVLRENKWNIIRFLNGDENTLTKDQFKNSLKNDF